MHFVLNDVEKKKIETLFNQHELNIDYLLYLQPLVWNNPSFKNTVSLELDPYKKRDFLFDNIEKNHPSPNAFVNKNIRWDTKLLRIKDYQNNPYFKALNNLTFIKGDWELKSKTLKAYSLFPYEEEHHYGGNYYLKESLAFFDSDYSYPSLSLLNNEWMSLNPYEIRTMETPIITAKGRVLTLGLGLGYFAYMAHLKKEVKEVHIVEMDIELIKIFNEHLLPLFPYPKKIIIHKADAYRFINNIKDGDYDFIFSDLWHDASDGLISYLKLKQVFKDYKKTQLSYWIEGSLVTFFRTLVIGVMKDEFYHRNNDYNEIQKMIKNKLANTSFSNTYDIDEVLSIKGLNALMDDAIIKLL